MKKNYDNEQENTTAYRVHLMRQDRKWSQKELADQIFLLLTPKSADWKAEKTQI